MDMEQNSSRRCSMACLLKDGKLVYYSEKSTDPGQCRLSKSRSQRLMTRRWSNSFSICVLPSIPEYPGFQDTKRNYPRGNFVLQNLGRTRLENSPSTRVVNQSRNVGCKTKSYFCDKTLQEYYNDRLMELRNVRAKKCNGKVKGYPDENQSPRFTSQRLRRRNSCGAMIQTNLMKLTEDSCDSADQVTKSMTTGTENEGTNQECCKRTYLESLTMSINGPLEMLVRRE